MAKIRESRTIGALAFFALCAVAIFWFLSDSRNQDDASASGAANKKVTEDEQARTPLHEPSEDLETGREQQAEPEELLGVRVPTQIVEIKRASVPETARLMDSYEELSSSAIQGNGAAAIQLGKGLAECASAPRTQQQLEEWTLELQTTGRYPGQEFRAMHPYQEIERFERLFSYCDGVDATLRSEFLYWLKLAAEYGDIEAATYFENSVAVPLDAREAAYKLAFTSTEEELAFKVRSLKRSASSGSIDSMIQLSQQIRKGFVPEMTELEADALLLAGVVAREKAGIDNSLLMVRAKEILERKHPYDRPELTELASEYLETDTCCVVFEPNN